MLYGRGLIPARAGNTSTRLKSLTNAGAHPRSRGEHTNRGNRRGRGGGSSPLARGTQVMTSGVPSFLGLIPARAGNTLVILHGSGAGGAHPRSRGEHCAIRMTSTPRPGSSPLARGTPIGIIWAGIRIGLIPARAGNTASLLVR